MAIPDAPRGMDRIYVSLDTPNPDRAASLVEALRGRVGGFKLGKEFLAAEGPRVARRIVGEQPLFLDVKFHDIPNTVASALRAIARQRPAIVNVHASGGAAMMRAGAAAVRDAAAELDVAAPWLVGVTVLTSLDEDDLKQVGQRGPIADQVVRLAGLAQECGLDGVVCSPREIRALRKACGPGFKLIVPGIRPSWANAGDQKRIMTPGEALSEGADILVIGRPITASDDPRAADDRIAAEITRA